MLRNRLIILRNYYANIAYSNYWKKHQKSISALIRVRDGQEFLEFSINSIINSVEEVIIIDNLSVDSTPEIISKLQLRYGTKIIRHEYPHDVVRLGEEHYELMQTDPYSPRLASTYYNWSLRKCSFPFVIKWDDDMIATKNLLEQIELFKKSPALQMDFGGENIAPDFKEVLTWKAGIEPRIFPRRWHDFRDVSYDFVNGGNFGGEAVFGWVSPKNKLILPKSLYAHMKYCKARPGSNMSPVFENKINDKIKISGPIPDEIKEALEEHYN